MRASVEYMQFTEVVQLTPVEETSYNRNLHNKIKTNERAAVCSNCVFLKIQTLAEGQQVMVTTTVNLQVHPLNHSLASEFITTACKRGKGWAWKKRRKSGRTWHWNFGIERIGGGGQVLTLVINAFSTTQAHLCFHSLDGKSATILHCICRAGGKNGLSWILSSSV